MKKKVLIIVPFLHIDAGGLPKVTASLTKDFAEKYDFSIITLYHTSDMVPFIGKYYTLNVKYYHLEFFPKFKRLKKLIKSISPDLIISFMNFTSFMVIPIMYLSRLKIPLIIHVNSNPDMQYRKRIYFKYLVKFLFPRKKVSVYVTVSKDLKKILSKNYGVNKSRILPIYNGIDFEKVLEMSKEKIDLHQDLFNDPKIFKFINIGRLSGEKGTRYLIEAFSEVSQQIPNSMLFILGEGQERPDLEGLIKSKSLEKKIFLLGYLRNPFKYLSKSDILVLPSLYEGLPYTLVEALVCKVPIISTNCPTGPIEILEKGKYGILAKVADSNDLADKMIRLAKDEALRTHFSEISHQRIREFDNQKFIQKWSILLDYYLN